MTASPTGLMGLPIPHAEPHAHRRVERMRILLDLLFIPLEAGQIQIKKAGRPESLSTRISIEKAGKEAPRPSGVMPERRASFRR